MKQHAHLTGDTATGRLIAIFNRTFSDHSTRLVGGGEEPLYLPAGSGGEPAQIIFTRDYFSSALHEVAHWCVAGAARRRMEDYGYWYVPDGRNNAQQAAFEQVEVKPQALEWVFSVACRHRFRISADNIDGDIGPSPFFKAAVWRQAVHYCREGLPQRAGKFVAALGREFSVANPLSAHHYTPDVL